MTEPSVLPQPRRTRPWDTGPEATARDVAALRFVGEQYTARLDVLAVVLGRLSPGVLRDADRLGDRTVRQRVERWEAAGWAERRRMLGHTWVLATRGGLRLAGLDLEPWTPALDRLAHHHAAAVVRLHREAVPGQGGWQGISEAWELVEVELPQKARPRVVALRPGSRTRPGSPTTSPRRCRRRCRPSSPASSASWEAVPRSPWSRSRRCPA
jgi:hypothetical protein